MAFLDFLSGGISVSPELFTTKKSYQTTNSTQNTTTNNIVRNYDLQYNIASDGSSISTKKEQAISQTPTVSPSITVIPTSSQGTGSGDGSESENPLTALFDNVGGIAIIGIIGFTAFLLLRKNKGGK